MNYYRAAFEVQSIEYEVHHFICIQREKRFLEGGQGIVD